MANVRTPDPSPKPVAGEATWRNVFFYLSAVMAAMALVDFEAGRLAHGLGDAGVALLMLSLMTQFPFVRAMVDAGQRSDGKPDPKAREHLLRAAEQLRAAHPWADRLGTLGWVLLFASLLLRATGAA